MKRGTPYHKKMHRLAEALDVPLPMAVGIMEMLWHHAAQHAPEGDIGSLPDVAISMAVFWPHDHERLINGLVESNWLERHDLYRLIIHDWPDHCEQSVKKWLDRNQKSFLPVYGQRISSVHPADIQMPDAVPPSREAKAMAMAMASVSESDSEILQMASRKNVDLEIRESPTPLDVLDELQPIYISAGAPIPGRHSQMILQQLMGLDGKGRQRVLNYVKWALYSGKWPTPAKTKALRSVLADGDWDVEITPEMLQRARAPGNGNSREDRVLEMYERMQEAANGD